MTCRVLLRLRAEQDVADHAIFISNEAPGAAVRFLEAFDASIEQLVEHPRAGKRWNAGAASLADLRWWPVHGFPKYLIFYRFSSDAIEVIRVLHGAQDIERILGR